MLARKALAGTAGAPKEYVEDVFSTYLYTGNGSTQTITNNIDLSGEGGLVWTKCRNTTWNNAFVDTVRGGGSWLNSNDTAAAGTGTYLTFNTDGYLVNNSFNNWNGNTNTYVSWTFRKAKKFFDVVTYTGNGSAPRDISHNLGSSPGFIIIKRTDSTGDWWCWHRSTTNANANFYLNYTDGADSGANPMISAVSSTNFTLATNQNATMNINGATYVAYLFAHDAGGFGDAGDQSIIKCGSFTTNGSGTATVDLGWEPQWYLQKSEPAGSWWMTDNMRGFSNAGTVLLRPHLSDAEYTDGNDYLVPNATGFTAKYWSANTKFLYIAIRRGPMKTPTSGTSVFTPKTRTGTGSATTVTGISANVVDVVFTEPRVNGSGDQRTVWDRMRGASNYLVTTGTGAEANYTSGLSGFDVMNGYKYGSGDTLVNSAQTYVDFVFTRAPGFFDVVCYTGTGSNRTVSHNLGVAPELMLIKARTTPSVTGDWLVYSQPTGNTDALFLNTNDARATSSGYWNNTTPTSSSFTVGVNGKCNESSINYVAYLFASVSGVSKVGSYTGNGSSVTVTTGFQPRFILVKRTDSTGNWIVSDSARGLVAGSDPYLLLNSTAAEDTDEDWVDITSTSFTVNQTTAANANVNTGTYIYLCIA